MLNPQMNSRGAVKHRPRPASVAEPTISPDSLLEGTGFEPSVPRERLVPPFSFTPTFPLARVNRPDSIPKAYITRGPMVRIRLPPAASHKRTLRLIRSVGYGSMCLEPPEGRY